ncbi:MAG TPA: hypothetical protein VHX86_16900 [Tepidisphaeraceae bacterium]|jgi:hypothetical protein|nr:hypothetical protein [Tepidisphaeraceae bacterium]
MPTVDLNAPTIPAGARAWRLFPGRRYSFLEELVTHGAAYLDIPGFEMPIDVPLSRDPNILPKIARSQDLILKLAQEGPGSEQILPLDNYLRAQKTGHRTKLAQAIINLYEAAKAGDYVITPEPLSFGRIWVGRFTSDDVTAARLPRKYGNYPIPARSIQWFGSYPENTISSGLSASLRHENPFTVLERSTYTEIFGLALGSFVFGERHLATIYNDLDDFLDSDGALLGAISRLASAATQVLEHGGELAEAHLIDVLLRNPPIQFTCSQQADIHSPGFTRFTSGKVVALVIAAVVAGLIVLSEVSTHDTLANDIQQLTFVNTGNGADPACTARVSEASKRVLTVLGIDRTWVLCEAAHTAKQRAGLRSSARQRQ